LYFFFAEWRLTKKSGHQMLVKLDDECETQLYKDYAHAQIKTWMSLKN